MAEAKKTVKPTLKAKTNAYMNKSFVKDGSYLDGVNVGLN